MNGAHGPMRTVMQQHRDAVGGRDADARSHHVSHQSVDAFEPFSPFLCRETEHLVIDNGNLVTMHLMRHNQMAVVNAQKPTEHITVLLDGIFVVTAVRIDVKFAVAPLAIPPLSRGAEGRHVMVEMI